jgi:hypothetical protein
MAGLGPVWLFLQSKRVVDNRHLRKLLYGMAWYWVATPAVLLSVIPSYSFYFWIVLQPLICMGFFIGVINAGFHAFIEQERVPCVESATLIGSLDDYFGEDDHQTHHLAGGVYYKDLPEHQSKQHKLWAKHKATVFYGPDALTFGILILLKAWHQLADLYIDYSGEMTTEEIAAMLEARARRLEFPHEHLLPPLQDKKVGKHERPRKPFIIPNDSSEGSCFYRGFMKRAAALQNAIANEMIKELPKRPDELRKVGAQVAEKKRL